MGTQAANGTSTTAQAALAAWQAQGTAYLQGLADPEFFAMWAAVRNRLALTPASTARHADIKRLYDAVTDEFRRRMNGGLRNAS
jgi:hypothetical protein